MKKTAIFTSIMLMLGVLSGCAKNDESSSSKYGHVASQNETVAAENVVEEGMTPLYGSSLKDGTYDITVDSSSSMFKITECELTVKNGEMQAKMIMSGTSYLYLYMGTASEAASAKESSYIPFEDNDGVHSFTVPVEALDMGISCAAFSKNKEQWYDRTLVFREDSLTSDAYADGVVDTTKSLDLADGEYTVEVTLSGGSGKASVESPADMTVSGGKAVVTLIWSSPTYDYMVVDGEKYFAVNSEGNARFEIPVTAFDADIPIKADTTAMSKPYEIDYVLNFSSSAINEK